MMLDKEISEFARRMDMPSFALNEHGLAALSIEGTGTLFFENSKDELVLYLALPYPAYDKEAARRALAINHYKNQHPIPIVASAYNDQLIVLTKIAHKELSAALIENSFQYLNKTLQKIKV